MYGRRSSTMKVNNAHVHIHTYIYGVLICQWTSSIRVSYYRTTYMVHTYINTCIYYSRENKKNHTRKNIFIPCNRNILQIVQCGPRNYYVYNILSFKISLSVHTYIQTYIIHTYIHTYNYYDAKQGINQCTLLSHHISAIKYIHTYIDPHLKDFLQLG